MKINMGEPKNDAQPAPERGGGVVVARKLNKVSERIDSYGNVIDPRTKQIIKKNTE